MILQNLLFYKAFLILFKIKEGPQSISIAKVDFGAFSKWPPKTFVLIGDAQFAIFDKSCIFIGSPFKKIIKKSTGSKSKDSISLKTSPLDFLTLKMYILTPSLLV